MNDHSITSTTIGGQGLAGARGQTNIVVFGYDVAEISQIRRIRAFRALGHSVTSFTMRRANMNLDFTPEWPNVHLYETENEKILKRALVVARSIVKMSSHREALRNADLIIARNLDMLAIAWAARRLAFATDVPLIYECLDIHDAMTGSGAKSVAMRRAERFLLSYCALIAVSSPGFIREYFGPYQGYEGPQALLENKLAVGATLPPRPQPVASAEGPIRLGWVGTIRCKPSLDILLAAAREMGPDLQVDIHGVVHHHVLSDFDAAVAGLPNVRFHGPYDYPAQLPEIYGACDLVWAQDLWQRGSNSDWLLPNRIYEASWAGCPSIAVAGTETGRRIETDGLGWAVPEPDAAALTALLRGLSRAEIDRRSRALLEKPEFAFVQTGADLQDMVTQALTQRRSVGKVVA